MTVVPVISRISRKRLSKPDVTGLNLFSDVLRYVGAQSVSYPPEFEIHSHLKKHHVENRLKRLESGAGIDWGTAEALAIGSLLYQVFNHDSDESFFFP